MQKTMKKMKRMLAIATAVAVMLVAVTVPNFAASIETNGDSGTGYTITINSTDGIESSFQIQPVAAGIEKFSQTRTVTVVNNSPDEVELTGTYPANQYVVGPDQGRIPTPEEFWGQYAKMTTTFAPGKLLLQGETYTFEMTTWIDESIATDYSEVIDDKDIYERLNACFGVGFFAKAKSTTSKAFNVTKVWNDDNREDRPKSIDVQVFNRDVAVSEVFTLNEENGWNLSIGYIRGSELSLREVNVPEGYEPSYVEVEQKALKFDVTITNTWVGEPEVPEAPEVKPEEPPVAPEPPVVTPPVVNPPVDTDTPDDNNNTQPPTEEDTDTPDDNNNTQPPTEDGGDNTDTDTPDDNNNATPPTSGGADVDVTENTNSDQPKTGDASQMALYLILAGGAAAAFGVIARKKNTAK